MHPRSLATFPQQKPMPRAARRGTHPHSNCAWSALETYRAVPAVASQTWSVAHIWGRRQCGGWFLFGGKTAPAQCPGSLCAELPAGPRGVTGRRSWRAHWLCTDLDRFLKTKKPNHQGAVTLSNFPCNLSRNLLRCKLHQNLSSVTYRDSNLSRNVFVAASVAESRTWFYFSQITTTILSTFSTLHSVTPPPPVQLVSQCFARSANQDPYYPLLSSVAGLRVADSPIARCNSPVRVTAMLRS